jgi:hypothetical protein
VLMLSSPMCCLFWTKFVERTTLRRSLLSDLAIHNCLALVVINRVLPVDDVPGDDVTIGFCSGCEPE